MFSFATDTSTFIKEQIALPGRFALKNNINYSELHSQNRSFRAFLNNILACYDARVKRSKPT